MTNENNQIDDSTTEGPAKDANTILIDTLQAKNEELSRELEAEREKNAANSEQIISLQSKNEELTNELSQAQEKIITQEELIASFDAEKQTADETDLSIASARVEKLEGQLKFAKQHLHGDILNLLAD